MDNNRPFNEEKQILLWTDIDPYIDIDRYMDKNKSLFGQTYLNKEAGKHKTHKL